MDALAAAARAHGAELRLDSPVARVTVEQGRAVGVELASGESIRAHKVVSNADPKTSFFKLLGARHLDIQFTQRINRLRMRRPGRQAAPGTGPTARLRGTGAARRPPVAGALHAVYRERLRRGQVRRAMRGNCRWRC